MLEYRNIDFYFLLMLDYKDTCLTTVVNKFKHRFIEWEKEGSGQKVTRKPLLPSEEELSANPRSSILPHLGPLQILYAAR